MNEGLRKTIKLFLLWWILFIVPIIIGTIVSKIFPNRMGCNIMAWSLLVGDLLIAIVFLRKRYVKLSIGRIERHCVWPSVGISAVIAVTFLLALMSFYELIDFNHFFPEATEQMAEHAQNFYSEFVAIFLGCVLAPLTEEIGFRGVLLGGLLKTQCRPWIAILISAVVFGLFHGFVGFPGAFLFGILIGWLYWHTNSLISGLIIHIINNSLSFIDLSGQNNAVLMLILLANLLLLTMGIWWFWKKCKYTDELNSTINS